MGLVRLDRPKVRPVALTNWWSWSGSNRRPPECKSGALPAELQPLIRGLVSPAKTCYRGRLDAGCQRPAPTTRSTSNFSSGDSRARAALLKALVWTGKAVTYFRFLAVTDPLGVSVTPATVSLRKEVIQPQVLLRLPCYDFTPIMNHTLGLFD